jgi:hypothetical protein
MASSNSTGAGREGNALPILREPLVTARPPTPAPARGPSCAAERRDGVAY